MYIIVYRNNLNERCELSVGTVTDLRSILGVMQNSKNVLEYKVIDSDAGIVKDFNVSFGWPADYFTKNAANGFNWLDDCDYMRQHTDEFIKRVFDEDPVYQKSCVGMVSAHGDKVEQYRGYWEKNNLLFRKAQIIYFLTYTKLMDQPKHRSKEWVLDNYDKYKDILP